MRTPEPSSERKADSPAYSRAFDNIVQGSNDVVGLLAYALFKESVREEVQRGGVVDGATRNPTPATVVVYRGAAEQRLAEVIQSGIAQATPDIQAAAVGTALASAEASLSSKIEDAASRVEQHISTRTSFLTALWTNLVAWAFTLAISVIILLLASRGTVQDAAVAGANGLAGHSSAGQVQGQHR